MDSKTLHDVCCRSSDSERHDALARADHARISGISSFARTLNADVTEFQTNLEPEPRFLSTYILRRALRCTMSTSLRFGRSSIYISSSTGEMSQMVCRHSGRFLLKSSQRVVRSDGTVEKDVQSRLWRKVMKSNTLPRFTRAHIAVRSTKGASVTSCGLSLP